LFGNTNEGKFGAIRTDSHEVEGIKGRINLMTCTNKNSFDFTSKSEVVQTMDFIKFRTSLGGCEIIEPSKVKVCLFPMFVNPTF